MKTKFLLSHNVDFQNYLLYIVYIFIIHEWKLLFSRHHVPLSSPSNHTESETMYQTVLSTEAKVSIIYRLILQPNEWQTVTDIFSDFFVLKMEALRPFETWAIIFQSKRRNIAIDSILNWYRQRTSNIVFHPNSYSHRANWRICRRRVTWMYVAIDTRSSRVYNLMTL